MNAPLVEVLLATYNGERFIKAQLDSLLSQTYSNFIILVRDDCSVDSTWEILLKYQSEFSDRIRLYRADHQDTHGPVANFSALLELSRAPYVMLCDQDDVWFDSKIEQFLSAMKELEKSTGANLPLLVHSDSIVVNHECDTIHHSFFGYEGLSPNNSSLNRLLVQNVVSGFSMMSNRELLNIALPIPEKVLMHDWWLALIGTAMGKIELIEQSTAFYRQHRLNTLGARKWPYPFRYFLNYLTSTVFSPKTKTSMHDYYFQAELLSERIKGMISVEQEVILRAFIQLRYQGWIGRRINMLRYRFLKHNTLKNIGLFLEV